MSKVKMRCTVCGKWFQSANAKEVTCPDCVQKARKEKLVAKNAPPPAQKVAGATTSAAGTGTARPPVAPPKPKPNIQSGTNQWLDKLEDVKIGQPDQPPVRPKAPPVQREHQGPQGIAPNIPGESGTSDQQATANTYPKRREGYERGAGSPPGNYRSGGPNGFGPRPRPPQEGTFRRGPGGPGGQLDQTGQAVPG